MNMEPSDILDMIGYHEWATQVVLDTAENLSSDQFTSPLDGLGGRTDLRSILVHTLDSGISWRHVLEGAEQTPRLCTEDFQDISAIRRAWALERSRLLQWCHALDFDRLNSAHIIEKEGAPPRMHLVWQTLLHIVNHGTQHRSEAALILSALGHPPGDLDYSYYLEQRD
jgi:uncharacterized damage-inducible protein DinB